MKKSANGKVIECTAEDFHRLNAGGGDVEIKHLHPEYASAEARLAALREVKRECTALCRKKGA